MVLHVGCKEKKIDTNEFVLGITGRMELPITKAGNLWKETELKSGVCFRHTEFWMHFTYIHLETMRSFMHQSLEFKSGVVWATGENKKQTQTETVQRMDGYLTLNEKR